MHTVKMKKDQLGNALTAAITFWPWHWDCTKINQGKNSQKTPGTQDSERNLMTSKWLMFFRWKEMNHLVFKNIVQKMDAHTSCGPELHESFLQYMSFLITTNEWHTLYTQSDEWHNYLKWQEVYQYLSFFGPSVKVHEGSGWVNNWL